MSLAELASFVEDGPWCATALAHPSRPVPHASLPGYGVTDEAALNPQPLPPHPETAARLWQAIRLHQYALMLAENKRNAGLAESLSQAAVRLYEDWDVPRLPWLIVLRWMGHPPPPPPWLELIGHAVSNAMIGARMGGDFGESLRSAAAALTLERLGRHGTA